MLERVMDPAGHELAIIIRSGFSVDGVEFLTPDDYSLQLGVMSHPAEHVIPAHIHLESTRTVGVTMEVLLIRSGRVRADLFDSGLTHIASRELAAGDVILLATGGHQFVILEDAELVEVKQGPFLGPADKARFVPDVMSGELAP